MDFPTLGLNFDLNDLVEGLRRIRDAKAEFKDLGTAADRTGDQVEAAGRQMTEASLATEAAAFKASRAHKSEEDAIRAKMRQFRDLERVMRDIERVESFQKRQATSGSSVDQDRRLIMSRMRLNDQQAREAQKLIDDVEKAQRDADKAAMTQAQLVFAFRQRMTKQQAAEATKAAEEERRSWNRVAGAIALVANETVRAAQKDAEARVRITQSMIAQNRQGDLTRDSLTREAMLVDRLTKELQELGQARANAARQSAGPGVDADLAGAAAATTVLPMIGAARSGLDRRGEQLAENEAREKGRRGIVAYMLALVGLGGAYDSAGRKQKSYGNSLTGLGGLMRRVRLGVFDLRFAVAALFGALTLGPVSAMADQMVALESRTRLYAKTAGDVPQILEETFAVAQRSRASLEGVATLYTRLAPLGDSLGRSQAQLLRVVETVSKAFSIGGAAASEATAGAQQFAQALSSNRFGGDELRSVAENAPVLLAAIAAGVNQINPALNLNAATFIKWAQAGNANSEIMVRALEAAAAKIDKMFASTTPTISQATVVIRNALTKLVDEVDRQSGEAGMRLSTNIAVAMQDFASFLTKDSTVDAMVGVVNAVKTALEIMGAAIAGTVTYFPALVTGILAFTAAAKSAMIASVLASAFKGLGVAAVALQLQFTAAGGGLAFFSGMAGLASGAVVRLGVAMKALGTALIGPMGAAAALTAGVAGLIYMKQNMLSLEQAQGKVVEGVDAGTNAYMRAITYLETFGGSTDAAKKQIREMNDAINASIGITEDQTRGLSAASEKALQRAATEKALTVALLRRAAAEQIAMQASLGRSAMLADIDARAGRFAANLPASRLGLPGVQNSRELNAGAAQREADARRDRSLAGLLSPDDLIKQADALARQPINLLPIEDGSGISNLGGAGDKDGKGGGKGVNGAINSIARLRAEVEGLNAQISALNTNPLSDIAARIVAAGREASAARTAGPGAGFADEAQRLAALKEEATIRLDLTKAIVEQNAASMKAGQTDFYGAQYDGDALRAMQSFYEAGDRSAAGFARALSAQAAASDTAEKQMADLAIAQQFGVTTTTEIADAYRAVLEETGLLTDETSAYADALQKEAIAASESAARAIDLAKARERAAKVGEARLAFSAETADLIDYARALREGAAALDAYNRRQREQAIIRAEGPAADPVARMMQPINAALQDAKRQEAAFTAEYEKRTAEVREQLRMAGLTTREREIEVEAMELAAAAGRTLLTDADRAAAKVLIVGREVAALAISVSDSIRQGFIDSGELSFDSLKEALGRAIRQTIYDELIAQPVEMVVKAVLEFQQKGLDVILGYIKEFLGGTRGGSMGDALGTFFGQGGKFGNFMAKFGETGTKLASSIGGLAKMAPQLYAAYEANKMFVAAAGSMVFNSKQRQENANQAASFGAGPIGALLWGWAKDVKRALAITAVEVTNGRFMSKGTRAYDGGPMEQIDAAGKALAVSLNKIVDAFGLSLTNLNGMYAVFGWTQGENPKALGGEGFFGGMLKGIQSLGGMSLDDIKGSALGKGVDFSQVTDAEGAIDRIMREMVIRIGEAQEIPFTEAEKALIRAAESLEEAAAVLKAARNVEQDLRRALLAFTNPREAAVLGLRDQQLDRRRGITDLVAQGLITADRLPGIEALLQQLEREELRDVLSRFTEGLEGAVSSLEDLRKAQERIAEYAQGLITGKLSPLSPSAQLAASGAEYQRLLAAANAGDATAMEKLTSASTDYLSAAQSFYASSPQYAAIFDQVYKQLIAISEREFEDPLIGVIETEFQRLIDAIEAGFLLLYDGPLNGDDPAEPALPDNPAPAPGTGGGGEVGGGGGGWGSGDMMDTMNDNFAGLNEQLAVLGTALVQSNDRAAGRIVDATTESASVSRLLSGGRVSQAVA